MRILRAADHKRMPWKNGGGETTEIAVSPAHAGLDDFEWRVSMARVDGDGPFSIFPGVERTLAILEGAGIVLDIDGKPSVHLTRDSEPHVFLADVPTSATLIGGTVIDFNVMSRRGVIAQTVERSREATLSATGTIRLILCSSGSVELAIGDRRETLTRHDAAILDATDEAAITPTPDGEYYLVEFRPA